MGFLQGKRALIVGVASDRSIAWGVAQAMHREGAALAFTYQNDKLKGRVEQFAAQLESDIVLPCDVASDAQIAELFAHLGRSWDGLDGMVHAIAFAPREALAGEFHEAVSRENFRIAHDISSYSFAALAKAGRKLMAGRNGSLLTLSYLGAENFGLLTLYLAGSGYLAVGYLWASGATTRTATASMPGRSAPTTRTSAAVRRSASLR